MSYCTIEEAWGLSEPFVDEPPKSKRRHKKKKQQHTLPTSKTPKAQRPTKQSANDDDEHDSNEFTANDTSTESATVEEAFINSPVTLPSSSGSGSSHYHLHTPDTNRHSFARSFETDRVPDAIDVSIGSAPFESENIDYEDSHFPDERLPVVSPPSRQDTYRQRVPVSSTTPMNVAHEEIEWMRNNMSHINDKIDKLTQSLETRQQHTQQLHSTTQAHDTIVFVLIGVFVLVLVDIIFRAGQRL